MEYLRIFVALRNRNIRILKDESCRKKRLQGDSMSRFIFQMVNLRNPTTVFNLLAYDPSCKRGYQLCRGRRCQ